MRWHFVGTARLAADTNAVWFNQLAALPPTAQFKDELLHRLAAVPYRLLNTRLPGGANDYTSLLKLFLDDLVRAEYFAELRAPTNGPTEFVLAAQIGPHCAALWKSNLAHVLTDWTGTKPDEFNEPPSAGWKIKKQPPPNLIGFIQVGDWAVFGWGHENLSLCNEYADSIRKHGRPGPDNGQTDDQTVLDWFIDWPKVQNRLEIQFGVKPFVRLPTMRITLANLGEHVLTKADLQFAEPTGLSAEPWCIPTNTIRDPLVSFTACRGTAPLLSQLRILDGLHLESAPNQLYLWALQEVPFQTFVAAPVTNATNLVNRLETLLRERLNPVLQQRALGVIDREHETSGLVWSGLPFIRPDVTPVAEPAGEFLLLGMFPNIPVTNPPPPELYAQFINRPEIVYYDWEITGARLMQLWHLSQLIRLIADLPQLNTESALWPFYEALSTNLGNTATHIASENPQKLTLVRRSQLGLTAAELVAFANWFDSDKFPLCGLAPPARNDRTNQPAAQTGPNAQTGRQH